MTRTRAFAPIIAAGLLFAACSTENDPSNTILPSQPAADSTTPLTEPTTTTIVATETTAAEPWEGDAAAAIGAIQDHLDSVHSGAAYYPQFVGVAIDPAAGRASIETSLDPTAVDTKTYALSVCADAAMVAFSSPARVRGIDVLDAAGNIVAKMDSGGECA